MTKYHNHQTNLKAYSNAHSETQCSFSGKDLRLDFGFKQSKCTKSSFPIKPPNRSHSMSTKQNSFFTHRHSFKSTRRDHSTAFAISSSQLHTHQISPPSKSRKVVFCTRHRKSPFHQTRKSKPTRAQQHPNTCR